MPLSESEIREILRFFDIGSLVKFKRRLEDGFQSENFHILTDKGEYVIRIIFDTEKNINLCMRVYDYLSRNGIKTPAPMRTKNDSHILAYKGQYIVIQTYIGGNNEVEAERINNLLEFYGKELGNLHTVSLKMVQELGKEIFIRGEDHVASIRDMVKRYPVKDDYINNQYKEWEKEIEKIPTDLLTKAVVHGDIGPKDFFFKNGVFTGIIDFNAAGYDYLLFDIAPMMMYCDLFYPQKKKDYVRFVHAYLEESPIKKEEFKWLNIILKTRWLLQIYFHQYRYEEGITRGLNTGKREENLEGVIDGKHFLKTLENVSANYFFKALKTR
ncbi:MAG: phosphotransferase [Promethearchaeota archaeon]